MNENNSLNGLPVNERMVRSRKRKVKNFLLGFIVLVIVGIGCWFGYQKLTEKVDKTSIYKSAITQTYEMLSSSLQNVKENGMNFDFLNNPVNLKVNGRISSNVDAIKPFTELTYKFQAGVDLKKEKMGLNLSVSKDSTTLNVLLAYLNNHCYLKSTNLIDKVLDMGSIDIFDQIEIDQVNIDFDKIDYIILRYKDMLLESLDEEKITITNDAITIDSKEYKGQKIVYHVDKEVMQKTLEYMIEQMKKDDKLINYLAELSNTSTYEIRASLNEDIELDDFVAFDVNVYTDASDKVIAIISKIEDLELKFTNVSDNMKITLTEDEQNLEVNMKDGSFSLVLMEDKEQLINLTMTYTNENCNIEFSMNIMGVNATGSLNLTNIKHDNKSFSSDVRLNIKVMNMSFGFVGDIALDMKDVETFDITNVYEMDELSDEDLMALYENLNEVLEELGLSELIEDYMSY